MVAFWQKGKKKDEAGQGQESQAKKLKRAKKAGVGSVLKKKDKGKQMTVPTEQAELINRVLKRPLISEAVMRAQELGKYTFEVTGEANKKSVARAVEALYQVKVVKVNILNYKPQSKMFRGKKGCQRGYKKAVVTLQKGDKINVF